ncbi:hypothetical protein HK102_005435 [Quaeritorhiza haematococci]|nr:hypothetical protein HK102_005435 [Quaeritorhiza haematococci]
MLVYVQSQGNVLVEIEEGVRTPAKIIPVMFTKDFNSVGSFTNYVYKTVPKDAVHVASNKSAHETFEKLFRNQIVSLNVDKLHDVIYESEVCALVRPFPTSFAGRASEINQVWEKVSGVGACIISAPGGMGKSCLAAKVAEEYEKLYNYVLWVNCNSVPTPSTDYARSPNILGSTLAIITMLLLETMCRWFARNRKYLLVLDNVDEIDVLYKSDGSGNASGHDGDALSGVLQSLDKFGTFAGDIIVTTRNPNIRKTLRRGLKMVEPGLVTLEKWDLDTTRSFLLHRTPSIKKRHEDPGEKKAFDALLKQLDGYPLATEQIGAYLMNEAVSIADCVQRLETILVNEESDEDTDANRGILGKIVALQFESIKAEDSKDVAIVSWES